MTATNIFQARGSMIHFQGSANENTSSAFPGSNTEAELNFEAFQNFLR